MVTSLGFEVGVQDHCSDRPKYSSGLGSRVAAVRADTGGGHARLAHLERPCETVSGTDSSPGPSQTSITPPSPGGRAAGVDLHARGITSRRHVTCEDVTPTGGITPVENRFGEDTAWSNAGLHAGRHAPDLPASRPGEPAGLAEPRRPDGRGSREERLAGGASGHAGSSLADHGAAPRDRVWRLSGMTPRFARWYRFFLTATCPVQHHRDQVAAAPGADGRTGRLPAPREIGIICLKRDLARFHISRLAWISTACTT